MYDEKYDVIVANFMENTTAKTILKSANICQNYERMYSGAVFLYSLQCITVRF